MTIGVSSVRVGAGMKPHRPMPVTHVRPNIYVGGLIVACPHSGRFYPPELIAGSRLDRIGLRRSEDAFVDILFAKAPNFGAQLFINEFGRAFVDVNRCPNELDPGLIQDLADHASSSPSGRVDAGLGVIPRTVGDGIAIYRHMITYDEATQRLAEVHIPWHVAIGSAMEKAIKRNGTAVLLDCHSMPTSASGQPSVDIVLGDRFGESCAPVVTASAAEYLRNAGLSVKRNDPFAGGYSTMRHANPLIKRHVLQIEINRSLYMVEGTFSLRTGFYQVQEVMSGLVQVLTGVSVNLS